MANDVKIPKRVQVVADRVRGGERLVVEVPPRGGARVFFWEPSGRTAGQRSVEQAISLGLIVAAGDGLFGDTQTYRAAE